MGWGGIGGVQTPSTGAKCGRTGQLFRRFLVWGMDSIACPTEQHEKNEAIIAFLTIVSLVGWGSKEIMDHTALFKSGGDNCPPCP